MGELRFGKVCIVAHGYMLYDGSGRSLGGIQTYVEGLARLLLPRCREIVIIQPSDVRFEVEDRLGVKVVGTGGYGRPVGSYYQKHLSGQCDMTICTHLPWAHWCSGPRLIAVHHGIGWDGFDTQARGFGRWLRKCYFRYVFLLRNRRFHRRIIPTVDRLICVDLNVSNWLRATYPTHNWEEVLRYIPNFGDPIDEADLERKLNRKDDHVNVLIARRFELIRGLPMMAQIIAQIYDLWPNARFVFAGWGSQKKRMQEILKGKDRCDIVRLSPEEIGKANYEADIAVVPTMWSEGTSLSCIEGMCAGAAVLATSIGGLGNLILPDYNGMLVAPRHTDIKDGLNRLLADPALRIMLARRGYESARTTFSRAAWERRVMQVIAEVA
jgi:glycosyltransferase involved in cell wall biosynthesis